MHQKTISRLQQMGAELQALQRFQLIAEGGWSVAAGGTIAAAREPSARIHLLEDGWAHRSKWLDDHRRQTTALLLPGDICDLDTLPFGGCDAHLLAFTPCRGVRVPAAALRALLQTEPSLDLALQRLAAAEAMVATEWMVSLGRRSAAERIAHLLCELAVRLDCKIDGSPFTYTLPLTQTDIADAMGLSVVHVNRSLQALRHEGMVVEKRRVTLANWERAAALANFDPAYLHLGVQSAGIDNAATSERRDVARLA